MPFSHIEDDNPRPLTGTSRPLADCDTLDDAIDARWAHLATRDDEVRPC